jgi:hypothetical protein
MATKRKIVGPGRVVNRSAKGSKLELTFDPSPNGFISDARRANERLKVIIRPEDGEAA